MDVTLYPDEDWTVDVVHCTDLSAVTLTGPDGSSVRIESTYKVLAEIGRRWAERMGDDEVTANGRNPDAVDPLTEMADQLAQRVVSAPYKTRTRDNIDRKIEDLETLLSDYHAQKGEERRYPDDFQPGDWVRFPPAQAWRQINRIYEGEYVYVYFTFGGTSHEQRVRNETRYPYMTNEAMRAVPAEEKP